MSSFMYVHKYVTQFSPGLLFAGIFKKLQIQFHYYLLACSYCLFLLDSGLAVCKLLEICTFLLGCPICWPVTVRNILLYFFVSMWYQLLFLLFHFLFIYLGPLFFLLGEPDKCL